MAKRVPLPKSNISASVLNDGVREKENSVNHLILPVIEKLKELINSGEKLEWTPPFSQIMAHSGGWAKNHFSEREYSGCNHWLLSIAAMNKGYQNNEWLTYNQLKTYAKENNISAHIMAGQKATTILRPVSSKHEKELSAGEFNNIVQYNNIDLAGPGRYPLRNKSQTLIFSGKADTSKLEVEHVYYAGMPVFNVEQTKGLDFENIIRNRAKVDTPIIDNNIQPSERLLNIVKASNVDLIYKPLRDGDSPHYLSRNDSITMPLVSQFKSQAAHDATLAHELVHSFGHPTRLNNNLFCFHPDDSKLSDHELFLLKAKKELRAELGAVLLTTSLGLAHEELKGHASYLKGYLSVLENNPQEFIYASADATKALNYALTLETPKLAEKLENFNKEHQNAHGQNVDKKAELEKANSMSFSNKF